MNSESEQNIPKQIPEGESNEYHEYDPAEAVIQTPELEPDVDIREPVEESPVVEPQKPVAPDLPAFPPFQMQESFKPWHRRFVEFHAAPLPKPYTLRESFGNAGRFWIKPVNLVSLILFLGFAFLLVYQAGVNWVAVIDDSYITFRFVDNFVQGFGWRYNPAGPRVEGFTNFLWAAMLVVPHVLRWDLMFTAKIMGLASGILVMAASWGLARAIRGRDDLFNLIPAFLVATNAHTGQWTMMGLETLLQVALVIACYWRFEAERRDLRLWLVSPVFAVLAAMTRIDSLYYLSPLGLYGIWLILGVRLPWRRMFRWGIYCAVPFIIYWGWKTTYFGDILPNTYYAKGRLVELDSSREMGRSQLWFFYFEQVDTKLREPIKIADLDQERKGAWLGKLDRTLWTHFSKFENSTQWKWFWIFSASLTLLMGIVPLIARIFIKKKDSFLLDVHFGKVFFLILLPWSMNLYYIDHVNGDWMPSFRFFQIVIPIIGVAAAVGFGGIYLIARALFNKWWISYPVGLLSFAAVGYLLVGNAYEQLKLQSVSVYGFKSVYWSPRHPEWYYPDRVRADYLKGFSPPLREVADYLLLNTVDNGYIFMSDIGQPMWFAEHLNLYDVDGLTDPYLSHAPSVRGRLPSYDTVYQHVLKEARDRNPEEIDWNEVEKRADRLNFENHLERNTEYIMVHRRPEYLLLFENHPKPDPKTKGYVYPEISNYVSRHPNMLDYVDDEQFPKIGNVYNHVYRRRDVQKDIPDAVKLKRLFRVIERNPRMPYLIPLLVSESSKMKSIPSEDQERISKLVDTAFERWSNEPGIIADLTRLSRTAGNKVLLLGTLKKNLAKDPRNLETYWSITDIYYKEGKLKEAIATMEAALRYEGPDSNAVQHHLTWLYEQDGRFETALASARTAVKKLPKEGRGWSDLGAVLERSLAPDTFTVEQKLEHAREAIVAFKNFMKFSPKDSGHIPEVIQRLEKFISDHTEKPKAEQPRESSEARKATVKETDYK